MIRSDIYETISCWKQGKQVEKQTYRIIGPAGVGKTAVCYQLVEELTELIFGEYNQTHPVDDKKVFEILMVKAPVLAREDFIVPFPVRTNNENFSFEELQQKIDGEDFEYTYDKIKETIFQSINENIVEQTFDEETGSVKLRLK